MAASAGRAPAAPARAWRPGRARQHQRRARAVRAAATSGGSGGNGRGDGEAGDARDSAGLSDSDMASLRERIELVETKEKQIADIEQTFEWLQDLSGGRLRVLDAQGRWQPFERSGWRGWAVVAAVALVPLLTTLKLWHDFSAAGGELSKLL